MRKLLLNDQDLRTNMPQRWELRSVSKALIWAYCATLITTAGINHALYPHTLHWYFGWLPCVPLRRVYSLPQRAHKGYV